VEFQKGLYTTLCNYIIVEKEVRKMNEKKLKTYVSLEPFHTSYKEDMTVEYYAAYAHPILFVRKVAERRDGSVTKLNIPLHELVEEKDLLRKFVKALPRLFMEIVEGAAIEEDYDAPMVMLSLILNELGGDISKLNIKHVLNFLKVDP